MNKTKLSIIIPTWNTAKITLDCVKTIKKYLGNFPQIVIVDNASTDNTINLLKKLERSEILSNRRKNIKLEIIKNVQNFGFAKACNIGAKEAVGDYLLFLNSDIKLVDNSLLSMLKFFSQNPQIGVIGPQFLNPDHSIQSSVFPPQTIKNAIKEFWLGQKTYSKFTPTSKTPISVWAISGGALLIKKELFKKINGWNEKYFMYFEDLELCRQIHHQQKQVFYYPFAKLIHHHGASGHKLIDNNKQWQRLIPGSKIYHGSIKHYLLFLIIYLSQKCKKLF